ncbi:efflux MFS transporter permease [Chryseobacterium sp. A301]
MYNKGPFASWVPKPLMLILILVIMFPLMTVSGVYSSTVSNVSGALATYTEYISFANNAGAIGMGVSLLILLRVKMRFRSREIITGCALILAVLSYICGTTQDPMVMVVGNFLIGFFKMFPMMEMVLPVMMIITPTADRGKFYAVFYPLSIGFGQLAAYYFAILVFNGTYQSPYFLMSGIMLIIALLSQIFQHNQRFSFKMPLHQIDWLSILLLSGSFMSLNYFLVFLKQQGWFVSQSIFASLVVGILLFVLLIYRQTFLRRKLIDFSVFKKRNVIHATLLLLFMGIYLASTSLYVQYTIGVLGYDNTINAHSNLWMIPGIVIAGILAYFGFKNKWNMKYYIAFGFICFALYTMILYFLIQPQMDLHYLEYAMVLKGLAMGVLFIGIWFYASLNLQVDQMLGMMAVLIAVRSFLGVAIGSALIGWAGYQAQWQSMYDLSNSFDMGAVANGMSVYKDLNLNALMASSKIVLGSLVWLLIPVLILVLTHSYGNFNFRRVILLRKVVRGSSIKGYRLK